MDKSSLDKDENEDKHSCCVSFFESGPCEKKYKTFLKKMLIIFCKEHLVTLTFC